MHIQSTYNAAQPLVPFQSGHLERIAAKLNDESLPRSRDDHDPQEQRVVEDAREDVELIVDLATANLVEDLYKLGTRR